MLTALSPPWGLAVHLGQSAAGLIDIGVLPVIALMTRTLEDGAISIEPVVAMQSGRICRASELEWKVLFLYKPGEDPQKIARKMYGDGSAGDGAKIQDVPDSSN